MNAPQFNGCGSSRSVGRPDAGFDDSGDTGKLGPVAIIQSHMGNGMFGKARSPIRAWAEWAFAVTLACVLVTMIVGCGIWGKKDDDQPAASAQGELNARCPVADMTLSQTEESQFQLIEIADPDTGSSAIENTVQAYDHIVIVIFKENAAEKSKESDHLDMLSHGWTPIFSENRTCIVYYKTPRDEGLIDAVSAARLYGSVKYASVYKVITSPAPFSVDHVSNQHSLAYRGNSAALLAPQVNGLAKFAEITKANDLHSKIFDQKSPSHIGLCITDFFTVRAQVPGVDSIGNIEYYPVPATSADWYDWLRWFNNEPDHGYKVTSIVSGQGESFLGVLPNLGVIGMDVKNYTDIPKMAKDIRDAYDNANCRVFNFSFVYPGKHENAMKNAGIVFNDGSKITDASQRVIYAKMLQFSRDFFLYTTHLVNRDGALFVLAEPNNDFDGDDLFTSNQAWTTLQSEQIAVVSSMRAIDKVKYSCRGMATDFFAKLINQDPGMEGNSFAAPIISAVANAMFNANPSSTPKEVKDFIKGSVDQDGCLDAGAALSKAIASVSDHMAWPTNAAISVEYLNIEKTVAKATWPAAQPGPAKYDFYLGDLAKGVSYSVPSLTDCEQPFKVGPKTAYHIRIKAKWAAGEQGPKESAWLQTVWKQPGSDDPPTVTATLPASGFVGQALFFAGTATDDVGLAAVRMEVNGVPTGEQTLSGKSAELTMFYFGGPSAAYATSPGTYAVKLVARDVGGQETGQNFTVTLATASNPGRISSVSAVPQPYLVGSGQIIFSAIASPGAVSAGLKLRGTDGNWLSEEAMQQTSTGWERPRTISSPGTGREFTVTTYGSGAAVLDSRSGTYAVGMPAPTGLAATQDAGSANVQVYWDASPTAAAVTYKVFSAGSQSGTKTELSDLDVKTDAVGKKYVLVGSAQGLAAGTTYWFWAKAACNGVTSDFSAGDPGSYGAAPPNQPPAWSGLSLASQVTIPARISFSGNLSDAAPGIKSVGMKVKKPDGSVVDAFAPDQFPSPYPTAKDLSAYSFRTTEGNYATVPGTYETWLYAADAAGLTSESQHLTVRVFAADAPPGFSGVTLKSPLDSGERAYFTGSATDDVGLASIRMTVDGTDAFGTRAISGTNASLTSYYFGGPGTTYATAGTHTATLYVKDTAGQESSRVFTVVVRPADAPPAFSPDASLPATVAFGQAAAFSGSVTDDVGLASVRMTVDGADVSTRGLTGTIAQLYSISFGGSGAAYATVGTHAVTLVAKDTSGQETPKSFSITVLAAPTQQPVFSPDAGLSASLSTGSRAYFTGTVSDDQGIARIEMTVNGASVFTRDLTSASTVQLSQFYFGGEGTDYAGEPGSYSVALIATDTSGATRTLSKSVQQSGTIPDLYEMSVPTGKAGTSFTFTVKTKKKLSAFKPYVYTTPGSGSGNTISFDMAKASAGLFQGSWVINVAGTRYWYVSYSLPNGADSTSPNSSFVVTP